MRKESFTNEISLSDIHVTDSFWSQRMELVRTKVLPYEWDALNDRIEGATTSHAVANFKYAAELTASRKLSGSSDEQGSVLTEAGRAISSGLKKGFEGFVFQDSDIAKWLEAVAYTLMWHSDDELERTADEVIDLVCSAQQDDGYLDTFYIINGLNKRWTNLQDNHELYCLGHMLEAAVAYYDATHKDKLLNAMKRYVDYVDTVFGPEENKKKGYPGHEEVELALVKLFKITGEERYLKLAKYFIRQRGQEPNYFLEEGRARNEGKPYTSDLRYYQADEPVTVQMDAKGHAVRAMYLYTGMADVAKLTGDDELYEACLRLWKSVTKKQMYITGSIGSTHVGEAFSFDYDLPNASVYGESCAAIGLALFAHRMLQISPSSEYGDVLEKVLYNGIISGISLDGTRFFYVNPLEVYPKANHSDSRLFHVKPTRQKWFGCACCPPNIARLTASVGGYLCSASDGAFYTHVPAAATVDTVLGGKKVRIILESGYPWNGSIKIRFETESSADFIYGIRIPGWCDSWKAGLNGKEFDTVVKDGYLTLDRTWNSGDELTLELAMNIKLIAANNRVRNDIGKAAVMRGPVVYCLEEADNGTDLHLVSFSPDVELSESRDSDLNGIVAIYGKGKRELPDEEMNLYSPLTEKRTEPVTLRFIPYFSWANRGEGEMQVWTRIER